MSGMRTSLDVVGAVEGMSEKRAQNIAGAYADSVLAPLGRVVDRAEPTGDDAADARSLITALGDEFDAIDTNALAGDVADHLMQAALIGVATVPDVAQADAGDIAAEIVES